MKFASYFRLFSYTMIAVAMFALGIAGGLSVWLEALFLVVMVVSWKLEDTRWQLPERVGLAVVLLSIPLFYADWQYQKMIGEPVERLGVNALAHLIVFLSAVKLLQVKKDRDWVFLYLISFFEMLLAAGLSISPIFLVSLSLYLIWGLSAITAFEIQKARRVLPLAETRLLVPPDSRVFKKTGKRQMRPSEGVRLPFFALGLLVMIFALALPLFLIAPRSGAAVLTRGGGGLSSFIGFSENVTLGQIGELKRDNGLVMRVRIEEGQVPPNLRWRGVALDEFTGTSWRKSREARRIEAAQTERGFFKLGTAEALHRLTTQTFFLEPLESTVLFAATRPVAIQGDLAFVHVDGEGSLQTRHHEFERIMYKAISDIDEPRVEDLRRDRTANPPGFDRYTQLPENLDPRIVSLASETIYNAHARNRYDAAKAIEHALQTNYGYTLQMRAKGPDPLADFLFNVKAGHCEYFSSAMVVMLRGLGVAARVVNGFLPGEYNDAAGAYTVRQSDAHSWVEVYFPESNSWITFDPTPSAGRTDPLHTGFVAQLHKYAEAMELIWFQYVVGYDKQEQRNLATSFHSRVFYYGRVLSTLLTTARNAIPLNLLSIVVVALGLLLLTGTVWLGRRVIRFGWRGGLSLSEREEPITSGVQFYERMIALMAVRGLEREKHLTPLEFASQVGSTEAAVITNAYNRVRFGKQQLSSLELKEINRILTRLEEARDSRLN